MSDSNRFSCPCPHFWKYREAFTRGDLVGAQCPECPLPRFHGQVRAQMSDKELIDKLIPVIVETMRAGDAYVEPRKDQWWWVIDGDVNLFAVATAVVELVREYDRLMERGR